MSAATYWVSGKPARLRYCNGVMLLERDDGASERIGLGALGSIIISGQHQIDSALLRAATERGCQVLLLDRRARGGVWLSGTLKQGALLRAAQHHCYAEPQLRLALTRELLAAKFAAQIAHVENASPSNTALQELTLHALRAAIARLELTSSLDALRGTEGAAAAQYWRWFAAQVPAPFVFSQRARRPPPDPVNACLSLAYVMAEAPMLAALHACGFDPAVGFLHEVFPARASLLFDLIEPLRPGVDAFVLRLLTCLGLEDFRTEASRGCFLSQSGQRRFFSAWAHACQEWPQLNAAGKSIQIEQAARAIAGNLRSSCLAHAPPPLSAADLTVDGAELSVADIDGTDAASDAQQLESTQAVRETDDV